MKTPDEDSKIETMLKDWNPALRHTSEHFVDQVMQRVHDLPTPQPWWRSLFAPQSFAFRLRPATIIAFIFILGIGTGYWLNRPSSPTPNSVAVSTEGPEKSQGEKQYLVKFIYMDPHANSVHIIGDFNHWQQTPLHHQAGGLWTLTVPITEGDYNYQFVIDGKKFVTDPTAPEKNDDGYGQTDSVLSL